MKKIAGQLAHELQLSKGAYQSILDYAHDGVYLYGAGFVGRWSVGYLEKLGISVLGFLDSDEGKLGQVIAGKQVLKVSYLRENPMTPVLISSRHAVRQISVELAKLPNPVLSIDAFVVHHDYVHHLERLEQLFKHDAASNAVLYAALASMLVGNTSFLAAHADPNPYFNRFGFFNRDREVFVDAGAYVGDSVERFIWSVNGIFDQIHAFEPSPQPFNALKNRTQRLKREWAISDRSMILNNAALIDHDGVASVVQADSPTSIAVGAQVTHIGTSEYMNTVRLDSYLKDRHLTFMKVDVEGSEEALLRGGTEVLSRCRPRIALSVYHHPNDLINLTLLVTQINSDYILSLGHHSTTLTETVLYCRDKND
jgi:FkbM family methyltransferase